MSNQKKTVKVRDLKPNKDAKGGGGHGHAMQGISTQGRSEEGTKMQGNKMQGGGVHSNK